MGDNVNHPNHYQNIAGVEAIDILNDVVKDLPGKQAAMLCGTCEKIRFTNEFARDMFVAEFFNKLNSEDYKEETYSIIDVLINSNYIVPNETDDLCIKLPWKDIFERFKMSKEDDKYVLEFVYKNWNEK